MNLSQYIRVSDVDDAIRRAGMIVYDKVIQVTYSP